MICPDTLIETRTGTAYIGRRIPEEGITRRVAIFELQATNLVDEALDRND